MGDDELKKELQRSVQRSYSHSQKAREQAFRIVDRRIETRDALTAASQREDQLLFDRKAKHRIGYEERSREKLKNSPLAADLAAKDSKVSRQRRSDERRQQLQQDVAEKQRKDEWEARFRAKQADKHREWELKKLQAEKRDNLESEFVLKARLDAAWSARDVEHIGASPKRCTRDLQQSFFHGGAFIGPTRGSIRPSKGTFVGPGPQSTPPRLRTYSTSLPELRHIRPQSLPSLNSSARSPKAKAAAAKSPSSAKVKPPTPKSPSGRKSPAAKVKPPTPKASSSEARPPDTPDPKPASPMAAEPPSESVVDPPPPEADPLECTQLPEQQSSVHSNGPPEEPGQPASTAEEEGAVVEEAKEKSPTPSETGQPSDALARTRSGQSKATEVTFQSAAGHGLAARGVTEGSSVKMGMDHGAFRLRREGDLLTFECPQGGLYVGLDASGAPLLVRTGAEASAKRGVFREVPALNGEGAPWMSIEDAGMPGRYLEADGSEDDLNFSTWKLVPC